MYKENQWLTSHMDVLFRQDETGRLIALNEPGDKPAPRFYIGITKQGAIAKINRSVEEDVARQLQQAVERAPWLEAPNRVNINEFWGILHKVHPILHIYSGPMYVFAEPIASRQTEQAVEVTSSNVKLLEAHFPDYIEDVQHGQPVCVVVRDQTAVSLCCSARQTPLAAEASLRTAPAYRGQGYAEEAVLAWAARVQQQGRSAMYSTAWNNLASQAVARKLPLRMYGTELHFS